MVPSLVRRSTTTRMRAACVAQPRMTSPTLAASLRAGITIVTSSRGVMTIVLSWTRPRRNGRVARLRSTIPRTQNVAENRLVCLARGPALRTLAAPDLALHARRRSPPPDRVERHAGVTQSAERAVVADAREHGTPGIDEAAGPERMAAHRRDAAGEIPFEFRQIATLDPLRR